ncbi:MAG: hypothetical protein OZ921_02375 [Sorangiineae bacterium]|nr:hypothetical protein [Polyangiaceae bacterium]MEB2321331.1 hypothetical protein [Sorangiineae bacterium]
MRAEFTRAGRTAVIVALTSVACGSAGSDEVAAARGAGGGAGLDASRDDGSTEGDAAADGDGAVPTPPDDEREPDDATAPDSGIIDDGEPDAAPEPEPDPEPEPEPEPEPCPALTDCARVGGTATEHHLEPLESCAFRLKLYDRSATARAELDQIAAKAKGYVALDALELNREATKGVSANTAERLKNHAYLGFRWNSGDQATADWYPQGITGSEDTGQTKRRVIASWYDRKNSPPKGIRISLVDLSNLNQIRYRHILLVEPNGASFGPVLTGTGDSLHGGGIVWVKDLLYVADTAQGFRVFDLSRIIRVTHTDDKSRIGVSGSRVDAFGYEYVAGQIARYRQPSGACKILFSFAGLDRTTTPPTIMNGEYVADTVTGRLAKWPLDLSTGWLTETGGLVHATGAYISGQSRMQGAFTRGSEIYISSSSQYQSWGRLYRTKVGQESKISAWVHGAEDLYYERSTDRVWTSAEHPNTRDVVSIPRQGP